VLAVTVALSVAVLCAAGGLHGTQLQLPRSSLGAMRCWQDAHWLLHPRQFWVRALPNKAWFTVKLVHSQTPGLGLAVQSLAC
jgi:hypothetical protein